MTQAIPSPSLGIRAPVGDRVLPVVRVPPTQAPVRLSWVQLLSGPSCPDPNGLTKPPRLMGGRPYPGYVGSSPIHGGGPYFHRGSRSQHQGFSFPSSGSTADQWRTPTFLGSSLRPSHLSSTVRACLIHFMGGLPMRLHWWRLRSRPRLLHCIL